MVICNKCNTAEMVLNPKTGKHFCSAKCWLNAPATPNVQTLNVGRATPPDDTLVIMTQSKLDKIIGLLEKMETILVPKETQTKSDVVTWDE